jgi:hypothetical protein
VRSEIPADIPEQCHISFVNILSRHGARYPTDGKTEIYRATAEKLRFTKTTEAGFRFLRNYHYTLGADDLTDFGRQQMVDSGRKFYKRYTTLSKHMIPFIRASGSQRVEESAQMFASGFHQAKLADNVGGQPDEYPYDVLVISEADGQNNTLNHGTCQSFEEDPAIHGVGSRAQNMFTSTFVPGLTTQLDRILKVGLSDADILNIMDMCAFETVASSDGTPHQICSLFNHEQWKLYNHYQSLGKWYGYGNGNPLGPTQGVGFVNELIARITMHSVQDHTSVNHTLDSSLITFPLDRALYADFSHDNTMTSILSAFGLYDSTPPLSNTTLGQDSKGYSAAWTVPFAARIYFEKMKCKGIVEELVRVVVNDRVVPMPSCGSDELGRCGLAKFLHSLAFAFSGGNWDMC